MHCSTRARGHSCTPRWLKAVLMSYRLASSVDARPPISVSPLDQTSYTFSPLILSLPQPPHCSSTIMPPSLDPPFFPHIFETIFLNSDRETLLTARLVSKSACRAVDPLLCGPIFDLLTESDGSLGAWSGGRTDSIDGLSRRLPYFHRSGNEATQIAAIRQAEDFSMHTSTASLHVNGLLQHLPPQSRISILHYDIDTSPPALATLPSDIVLPPCSFLQITVRGCRHECRCQGTGKFKHVSSSVEVYIDADYHQTHNMAHSQCNVMAGVINSGVTEILFVGAEEGMLPCLFNGYQRSSQPESASSLSAVRSLRYKQGGETSWRSYQVL